MSQNWGTIAYDHRGAGATIAPLESISFNRLVEDVFAILDAYNAENCVLAAESAGALTALGRQILDRASQAAAIALYLSSGGIDLRNELSHVSQPTLILHGEADRIVPVEEACQLFELLPNARVSILPGAGMSRQ